MNLQEAYEMGLLKDSQLTQLNNEEMAITKETSDDFGLSEEEEIIVHAPATMDQKNFTLKYIVDKKGYLATEIECLILL